MKRKLLKRYKTSLKQALLMTIIIVLLLQQSIVTAANSQASPASADSDPIFLNFESGIFDYDVVGDPQYVEGHRGNGMHIRSFSSDKIKQHINLGDITYNEGTGFTTSFWMKVNSNVKHPGYGVVMSNKNYNNWWRTGWVIYVYKDELRWNYHAPDTYDTNNGYKIDELIMPKVNDGVWHHIALSFTLGEQAMVLVDGKVVQERDLSNHKGSIDSGYPTVVGNDGLIDKGYNYENLDIVLDDIYIAKRALSQAEILEVKDMEYPIHPAPFVLGSQPKANAEFVPLDQVVTVKFNKPIQSGAAYGEITLKQGDVPVQNTVNMVGNELVITPSRLLASGSTHTVTIPVNAVADLEGVSNSENISFSFDTLVKPKLSFQVISDTHVTSKIDSTYSKNFDHALKDMKENDPDSAGIILVGDVTDGGYESEYKVMESIVEANKEGLPPIAFAWGNHDVRWSDFEQRTSLFKKYAGVENVYYDFWIEDYHFIVLGTEIGLKDASYLSDEQLAWLEEKLAENAAADKPIFLFHHQPLLNTVSGSDKYNGVRQDRELKQILTQYPQVVMFSGHTHYQLGSKHTMYNDKYATFFNTAAVSYLWTDSDTSISGSQGWYVEVYEDKLRVRGRDFTSGTWPAHSDYILPLPAQIPVVDPSADPDLKLGGPTMKLDKASYYPHESIQVTYTGSLGQDAFGIYERGAKPTEANKITPIASIKTNTAGHPDGKLTFSHLNLAPGNYDMIYLGETPDTELMRLPFNVVDEQPAEEVEVKVMSFNRWNSNGFHPDPYQPFPFTLDDTADAIIAANPDIVGVQEISGKLAELAGKLEIKGAKYYYDIGQSVLSKYPIVKSYHSDYIYVEVKPGKVIAVSNVHLSASPYGPYDLRDGKTTAAVLSNEEKYHMKEMASRFQSLPAVAEHQIPVFLTGDFNVASHLDYGVEALKAHHPDFGLDAAVEWPVSKKLEELGFRDSYREYYPDPVAHPGFTWTAGGTMGIVLQDQEVVERKFDPAEVHDRIDFVYTTGPATTIDSKIVGEDEGTAGAGITDIKVSRWSSDHRAVISTFSVTPAPAFIPEASSRIALDKTEYVQGEPIKVSFKNAANAKDWVGIYSSEWTPGGGYDSLEWYYLNNQSSNPPASAQPDGELIFKGVNTRDSIDQILYPKGQPLPPGTYTMYFLANDGYSILDQVAFKIFGNNHKADQAVLSGPEQVQAGESFELTYGLSEGTKLYQAQMATLEFDPALLQFEGFVEPSEKEGFIIVEHELGEGELTFIAVDVSKNSEQTNEKLVKLRFKAIAPTAEGGAASIKVTELQLANAPNEEIYGVGTEYQVAIKAAPVAEPGDVNEDGKFTIGDLALVVEAYGITKNDPEWNRVKRLDFNNDGEIGLEDLVFVARLILNKQ